MLIALCSASAVVLVAFAVKQSARLESWAIVAVAILLINSSGLEREIGLPRQLLLVAQEGLLVSLLLACLFRLSTLRRWQAWLLLYVAYAIVVSLMSGLPAWITASGLRLALLPLAGLLIGSKWRQGGPLGAATLVVLCSVPAVLLGARQALFGFSDAEVVALSSAEATYIVGDTFRLVGASNTGQEFAMLMVLSGLCGTWLALEASGWRARLGLIGAVASSALVMLSLQRLALAALAAGVVVLLLSSVRGRNWRRGVRRLVAVGASGLLGVLVLAPGRVEAASGRLGTLTAVGSDESFLARITEVWPRSLELIGQRPIGGWGAGSAGVLTVRYPWEFPNGVIVADNLVLHVTLQFGWVGILLLICGVASYCRALRGEGASLGRGVVAAIAVAGLVGTVLGLYAFMGLACVVLGACTRSAVRDPSGSTPTLEREASKCA